MYLKSVVSFASRVCVSVAIFAIVMAGTGVGGKNLRAAEPLLGPTPVVRVPTTVVEKGGSADASIEYSSKGAAVAGLQFDLEYDQDVIILTPALGSAGVAAGKELATSVLPNGNLRVLVVGFNETDIPAGDLVDLKIQVSPFADSGLHLLRCVNIIGVTPDAEPIAIDADQGRIVAIPSR